MRPQKSSRWLASSTKADLTVTETISVIAEGKDIRRGIFRVGCDPIGGPIVARWNIPDDVSPPLVYYIADKERLSNAWNAMTAAIINLSVKGYLLVIAVAMDGKIRFLNGVEPQFSLPITMSLNE